MCAEDLVSPHERPVVGMKLGGGYVKLDQEFPLKACEGEPKLDLLEHGGVDEAEGGSPGGQGCTDTLSSCSLMKERFSFSPFLWRKMSRSELMDEVSPNRVAEAHGYNRL